MSARLIYVMDPMCSWCWGFAPVMQALAEQAANRGVGLHLVVGGLRRERTPMDEAGRRRTLAYWQAVHEASGQPFDFAAGLPEGLVYDTEPACRALVAARQLEAECAWPLALLIQQAFYTRSEDVTQPARLVELAERTGLARDAFAECFDAGATREATAADFAWAGNLGIAGFPTVLAERDGQLALLTNGYQPLAALAPLLARWLERGAHG
ncbi:DsbA family protein [Pseudomonas sp. S5(2021)]|jgi:putative protein-disulfide isomerase|nr:DsbA family protein [Pseudomonas sp. S5(2021)]